VDDVARTLAAHGVTATREQAEQLRDTLSFEIEILRPRLFDGTLEAIEALRSTGARLATATNRSHTAQKITQELRYHNLAHHFDEVLTAGDVGWLKPHPAIVHVALKALDVPPERALMVGDEPRRDIAAANAAGITSVLITHPDRVSPLPATPDEHPNFTIASLAELLDLIGHR
jgi:HAD superfamily hydrolase (TIGR01509 family)